MPTITTGDGVALHVETTGAGTPLLFIHEFAGDHRSWEPQVRFFGRGYQCVTYAARGYPPSEVPEDPAAYSQQRAVEDAVAVLDGMGIGRAHVVGLSMGGFAALHVTLRHPDRVISAVVAGARHGCSSRTRTRAAGRSSPRLWRSIPRWARRSPCAACRRPARRCTRCGTSLPGSGLRCCCWWATRMRGAW